MSSQPRPGRHRGKDAHFVAQVVADAATIGIEGSAERHGISARTVVRYRKRAGQTPEVAAIVAAKKEAIGRVLDAELLAAQLELVARVVELAKKEPDLHKVAGALKIVSDARGADQVRELVLGAGAEGADGRQRDAGAPAGGAGPTPGQAASGALARLAH